MRRSERSPLDDETIDQLWVEAARRVGLRVERTGEAYASSDGKGTLLVGARAILDEDDTLAQLVFHELCHALVEGEGGSDKPDWGLDNASDDDVVREHACLRLQAHLADGFGLRAFMIPTTVVRDYYLGLPGLPLDGDDPACTLARRGAARATLGLWHEALGQALQRTAAHLQMRSGPAAHPLGFSLGPSHETCGTCAWRYEGGPGPRVLRCRQSAGPDAVGRRIDPSYLACDRWEAPVECEPCGACCREAYHTVSVSMRDPMVWRQPTLIVRQGHRFSILRDGDRCAALAVVPGESAGSRYLCQVYEDRPQTCRDFERGGRHCLVARRRVGLSR